MPSHKLNAGWDPMVVGRGRRRQALLGVFIMLCLVVASILPAGAQPAGGDAEGDTNAERVQVRLQARDAAGENQPVIGVSFIVEDSEGNEVASGETDDEGIFAAAVPGPGAYLITIDPDTLPDGISLSNPERATIRTNVDLGRTGTGLFGLTGEGTAAQGSGSSGGISTKRVAQMAFDGAKLGLFLAMSAIGLSLIFGTTGLTNFAHSEMMTFGMLATYFFNFYGLAGIFGFLASWPAPFGAGTGVVFAIILAVICGGLFGYVLDAAIFRPLRARGTSLIAQLVISIGLQIILRYFFQFIFGVSPRYYSEFTSQRARTYLGMVDIADRDLITMSITLVVLLIVGMLLIKTRAGKAMRAVADNRDLAESSGVNVQRVISQVWIAGGALAALGGTFIAMSENVSILIGFRMLLLVFAGVTLGGLGTAYGALIGCLVIGMGIQLSTLVIPAELKNAGALAVMIVVLLVRPQGILGRPERIG